MPRPPCSRTVRIMVRSRPFGNDRNAWPYRTNAIKASAFAAGHP